VTVGVWARGGASNCHLPLANKLIAPSNLVTKPALFARQPRRGCFCVERRYFYHKYELVGSGVL
jgi:hypothetical protein